MHLSTELSAPTGQFCFDLVHLALDKQLNSSMIRTTQNTLALHSGTWYVFFIVFTEGFIRCCQDLHLLNSVRRNGVKFHFSWPETTCFHQMFKPAPISLLAPASLVVLTSFSPSLSNKSLFYLCCSRALIHPMCSARSILTDGDRYNGIGWFWSLITGLDPLQEVKWKRSLSSPTGHHIRVCCWFEFLERQTRK